MIMPVDSTQMLAPVSGGITALLPSKTGRSPLGPGMPLMVIHLFASPRAARKMMSV